MNPYSGQGGNPLGRAEGNRPSSAVPVGSSTAVTAPSHVIPVFTLEDTFSSFLPNRSYKSAVLGSTAVADVDGMSDERSTASGTSSGGAASPALDDVPSPEGHQPRGVVVHDVATKGSVPLDLDARPNLNRPPSNWMQVDDEHGSHAHWPWRRRSDDAATTGLEELLSALHEYRASEPAPFAGAADTTDRTHTEGSTSDASMPHVVSGADELKELLMAPFVKHPLNLLVHRVGDSVLIEGAGRFDVPGSGSMPTSTGDNRRKALTSKLLYYSILAESEKPLAMAAAAPDAAADGGRRSGGGKKGARHRDPSAIGAGEAASDKTPLVKPATPVLRPAVPPILSTPPQGPAPPPVDVAVVPRLRADSAPPTPTTATKATSAGRTTPMFRRALQWKFDDLSILLGVRTPLVTAASKEMSLQVHSAREYVSQVQALDYWLDNVMNSVANVAVCFHTDGVVQGYRVVPTDELPEFGVPPFSPVAVKNHATDVLRWLRKSCSRDGGSYVLLKAPGDGEELRLYDLADLHKHEDRDDAAVHDMPDVQRVPPLPPPMAIRHALEPRTEQARDPRAVSAAARTSSRSKPLDMLDTDSDVDAPLPDVPEGHAAVVPASSVSDGPVSAFDKPIAIMCFRMAQCMSETDAEARRLYEKAIALFDERDSAAALVRATAHAACAQHAASSSDQESDTTALHHARLAVRDLAVVVTASTHHSFLPARQGVAPLTSALDTGMLLVRLMCGIAYTAINSKQWDAALPPMVVAQAFLALFGDHIPVALLTDNPARSPTDSAPTIAAGDAATLTATKTHQNAAQASGSKKQSSKGSSAPAAVDPAEAFRQQLLSAVASLEYLAADMVRSLLEDLGPSAARAFTAGRVSSTATSVERDEFESKKRDIRRLQIQLERETVEVMTLVARAQAVHCADPGSFVPVPTFEEALSALPDNIPVLRTMGEMDPSCDGLFDAALRSYQLALGHMPSTAAGKRSNLDVRRRIAKLFATRAQSHQEVAAACIAVAKTMDDDSHHRLHELNHNIDVESENAIRMFREASRQFIAVENSGMAARMAFQHGRMHMLLAERHCERVEGRRVSAPEMAHLHAAVDGLYKAVDDAGLTGEPPAEVQPEHWRTMLTSLASWLIICASRVVTLIGRDPPREGLAFGDPFMENVAAVSVPQGQADGTRVSLAILEQHLYTTYLLPAARVAKASRSAPMDVKVTDFLADVRRVFAGVDPLRDVPGLQPLMPSRGVRAILQRRPDKDRAPVLWASAITYLAAQRLHAVTNSTGAGYAVASLTACDVLLAYVRCAAALGEPGEARRIEAIEKAVGTVNDLKPWLQVVSDTLRSGGRHDESMPLARASHLTFERLAAVLLAVIALQKERGRQPGEGGVRELYAKALAAVQAQQGDAAAVVALLNDLPHVFRSFTARRK